MYIRDSWKAFSTELDVYAVETNSIWALSPPNLRIPRFLRQEAHKGRLIANIGHQTVESSPHTLSQKKKKKNHSRKALGTKLEVYAAEFNNIRGLSRARIKTSHSNSH